MLHCRGLKPRSLAQEVSASPPDPESWCYCIASYAEQATFPSWLFVNAFFFVRWTSPYLLSVCPAATIIAAACSSSGSMTAVAVSSPFSSSRLNVSLICVLLNEDRGQHSFTQLLSFLGECDCQACIHAYVPNQTIPKTAYSSLFYQPPSPLLPPSVPVYACLPSASSSPSHYPSVFVFCWHPSKKVFCSHLNPLFNSFF